MLAGVAVALVVALALNGTSVLPRLSTKTDVATPSVRQTPRGTHTASPPATPSGTPTADVTADPGRPVPGTVITARPAPRRCPSPPCLP